jgi:hypothetical protein
VLSSLLVSVAEIDLTELHDLRQVRAVGVLGVDQADLCLPPAEVDDDVDALPGSCRNRSSGPGWPGVDVGAGLNAMPLLRRSSGTWRCNR